MTKCSKTSRVVPIYFNVRRSFNVAWSGMLDDLGFSHIDEES